MEVATQKVNPRLDRQERTLVVSFVKNRKYKKWVDKINSTPVLKQFLDSSYDNTVWMIFDTKESRDRMDKLFRTYPHKMKGKRIQIR